MDNSRQDINIRKLTLPDGSQVGLINLDNILREVADLKLTDEQAIKKELLDRIKTCNYVVSGSEKEYESALIHEYQKKYNPEAVTHHIDPKKPHAG